MPPKLSGCILFAPSDARAIFLHNGLLCNGMCSVTWAGGGTNGKYSVKLGSDQYICHRKLPTVLESPASEVYFKRLQQLIKVKRNDKLSNTIGCNYCSRVGPLQNFCLNGFLTDTECSFANFWLSEWLFHTLDFGWYEWRFQSSFSISL